MRLLAIVAALYALLVTASPTVRAQQNASKPPQASGASAPSAPGDISAYESALLKAAEADFAKEAAAADAKLNGSPAGEKSAAVDSSSASPETPGATQSTESAARTESAAAPGASPAADLSARLGAVFDAPRPSGIPVRAVRPGTPAAAAALRPGDIIARLDGKKVHSLEQLNATLLGPHASEQATLRVLHRGAARTVHLALAAPSDLDSSIDSGRAQD